MGASESTSRKQENNSSMSTAAAVATAAAGVAFAAWGISKMLSDTKAEDEEPNQENNSSMSTAAAVATAAAGVAFAAWGISKMLSDTPRFKMNTDGACHPRNQVYQLGPSGFGGILRDHRGKWVRGFIGFIGDEDDSLTSEFHGILRGLELLDKLKLQGSILETDSQPAFQWVTRQGDSRGKSAIVDACWEIIIKCRQLAKKNDIEVCLVKGDSANRCADKLADMGIARRQPYVELEDCPDELKCLVEKDAELNG